MTSLQNQITIKASKIEVWNIISNLGSVHKFNPGVSNSYYTSDAKSGVGASRICEFYPSGKISETATNWSEGNSISFKVLPIEKAPPLKNFKVNIELRQKDSGTLVLIDLSYDTKLGWVGKMMNGIIIKKQLEKSIEELLKGLKLHVETGIDVIDINVLLNNQIAA